MDVSDPQTLGFMVFGGFMFISAVGIALVSTLSMKETSYEDALAKQRRKQPLPTRAEKKKKDKNQEKKNKAKRKDEKLEEEPGSDAGDEMAPTEPESEPEPAADPEPTPEPEPEPIVAAPTIEAPPAAAPKEKKKKKSAKVEPVVVAVETAAKEVLMMAVAPVVDVSPVNFVAKVTKEPPAAAKPEEPKEAPAGNKKKNKNKPEPVTDSSLLYGELLSAVSNRTLSEDQTSKLMEVLNQKAGDSWQLACQKGDPLSTLKKQLEEKEKLRTAEQEVAAAAKTRLKELSKELGAEKSKMGSLDARLKAELSAQTQKLDAMRLSMKAAEQEHLELTETLNQKVVVLQEQLENGPNAQLARLQQENSILRDALNQASSQAESRQNAELARMRSDCLHLSRELTERSDALRAVEECRHGLEAKMAVAEQEAAQTRDTERAVQQHLQEVMSELSAAQQEAAAVSELQGALALRDADLQELRAQLESQAAGQGAQASEVEQLKHSVQLRDEQVGVLEAELTALRAELQLMTSQREEAAGEQREGSGSETETEQPFESLEGDSQLLRLEEELQRVREELQQERNHSNENTAVESDGGRREAELNEALAAAEARCGALNSDFQASLQRLFPDVSLEPEQSDWLELFSQSALSQLQEAGRKQEVLQTELQRCSEQDTVTTVTL
ncbi:hypothetical protein CesoFtcFv8_008204 [Champsocephalus esox]|uniref:Ribosome receptor lysine/proline rich domain-containing protein n=1 Tax=Champsocephalus esox TaxID=159716 RepID=A0AAN8CBP5_9TELE|nr:hypothetical protein CesoFtcFv8_008204 [Champsocephalus esox]